jgi:hypothetical protein
MGLEAAAAASGAGGRPAGTAPQATGKWIVGPGGTPEQRAAITQVMLAGEVDDCARL